MRYLFILITISFLTFQAKAATITSTTGGGNWNTSGTWIGGIPTANDDVVINGPVTMNTSPTCKTLTINSVGTLTVSGSQTLTISNASNGTVFTNNGTFTPNSGTVAFVSTNDLQQHATAGNITFNHLSLTKSRLSFGGTTTINGTTTIVAGGSSALASPYTAGASATLAVSGSYTLLTSPTFSSVTINGGGTLNLGSSSNTLNVLRNSGGTCFTNNGTFTHSNGTVSFKSNSNSNTLTVSANNSPSFYDVVVESARLSISGINVNNNLILKDDGSYTGNTNVNAVIDGNIILATALSCRSLTINASKSLAVGGNPINITNANNATVFTNNGTFDAGTGTVSFISTNDLQQHATSGDITFNNLTLNKSRLSFGGATIINGITTIAANGSSALASSFTAGSSATLTVSGSYTLLNSPTFSAVTISNGGTLNLGSSSNTLNITRSSDGTCFTNNGTFTHSNGNVSIRGAGASSALTVSNANIPSFYNVTVESARVTFGSNVTISNGLVLKDDGSFTGITTPGVIVDGNITLSNTLACRALTINASKSLSAGSQAINITNTNNATVFTNNGTFNAGSGTVSLISTNDLQEHATSGTITFNNLTLNKSKVTFGGSTIINGVTTIASNGSSALASAFTAGADATLTVAGTYTLLTNPTFSAVTITGGTFSLGSYTLNINRTGSATCFTHSGGTFNSNTGTVSFKGSSASDVLTVSNNPSFYNVVVEAAQVAFAGSPSFNTSGSIILKDAGSVSGSSSAANITIDGTITLGAALSCRSLTINSGKSLSAGSNAISITNSNNGTLFTNNGTFNAGTGSVSFISNNDLQEHSTSGSITFNDLILNKSKITFGASTTINGVTTIINNSALASSFNSGANATLTVTGNYTLLTNPTFSAVTISSGTLNLGSNTLNITKSGSGVVFTHSGGSFNSSTGTVSFKGNSTSDVLTVSNNPAFYNVVVESAQVAFAGTPTFNTNGNVTLKNGGSVSGTSSDANIIIDGTITLGAALSCRTLTINSGRSLSAGSNDITISNTNNITVFTNNGTFNAGSGTVNFNSTNSSQQYSTAGSGSTTFNNVTLNNSQPSFAANTTISGVITITGTSGLGAYTSTANTSLVVNGTYNLSANTSFSAVTINGGGNVSAGSYTLKISRATSGTCFTNNGTFNRGTGTVEFEGASYSTVLSTSGNVDFHNVSVANAELALGSGASIKNIFTLKDNAKFSGNIGTETNIVFDGSVTLYSDLAAKSITVNSGKTLNASTYTITLFNSGSATAITNNGTFTSSGTVIIRGNSNGNTHAISGAVTFNNITIDNTRINFGSSIVNGTLRFDNGGFIETNNWPASYGSNAVMEFNTSLSGWMADNCIPNGTGNSVPNHIKLTSGTLEFNNGKELALKGTLTIASGATFKAENTCVTIATGFTAINNHGTCSLGRINVASGATWNLNADYIINTLNILSGGTVNANSYKLTLKMINNTSCGVGSTIFTLNPGGTFNAGTGTVVLIPVDWNNVSANVEGGISFNNVVVQGSNTLDIPNTNTMTVNGNLTVESGAQVAQAPNVNFGPTASVTNNGNVNGNTNNFPATIPSGTSGSGGGTVSKPQVVVSPGLTLTSNMKIDGVRKVIIVPEGYYLNAVGYTLEADSIYVYGKLTLTNQDGLGGFLYNGTKIVVGNSSTIEYAATSSTQTITQRVDYVNLILSGAATKSFAAGVYEVSGNFTANATPSYNASTIVRFDGSAAQEISCPKFESVEFTNGGTKTLVKKTNVTKTLTMVNATTLATNDSLVLVSDANGTAAIAAMPAGASITGNVTVQRYVPAVLRRSRMLSPNTTNFTFSDLKDNIFVTGTGGKTNGFDSLGLNQTTVYTYQESTTGGRGWKAISNISNTLAAGKGTLVFVRGDRTLPAPAWYTAPYVPQNAVTIDFIGPVNVGNIAPVLSYTNTGSSADDGWNMVGNPYPAPVSWDLINKSNLSPFYYTLNPVSGSYETGDGSSPIASGQGFFVKATGANPALTFTESSKVLTTPTSYFKTSSAPIRISMIKDSLNSDVAVLRFNNAASKGFDANEDALKMTNSTINFGFYIDANTMVQYNSTPEVVVADTFILAANASNGTYKIAFDQLSGIPSSKNVYLRDVFTNTVTDLRNTSEYQFTITSSALSKGNRFELIILDPAALPVKWLSVTAELVSNDVAVKWSTASEKNNAGFMVEKSADLDKWNAVQPVSPNKGGNTVNNYIYIDENPFVGVNKLYYRIKQTDRNGDVSYSSVVNASKRYKNNSGEIAVFPNPASTSVALTFGEISDMLDIEVYDVYGKLVMRTTGLSSDKMILDVQQLQTGVYTIKISGSQTAGSVKFVKE